ncbi:MAG: tetratricopeptide repeat protein [Planctomycetota bacterium]
MRNLLPALALFLSVSACGVFGGPSREERDRLNFFKQNAGAYFLSDSYEQALDMARRGLQIEPEDYELLITSGLCHLQKAAGNTRDLEEAERFLKRAFDQRSFEENRPEAILGYATVEQRLGIDHDRRARLLTAELARPDLQEGDRLTKDAQAKSHAERAKLYWGEARRALQVLLQRQEMLRFAHKGLMEIAVEFNDYDTAVKEGLACLAENKKAQDRVNDVIKETPVASEEIRARSTLQELLDQEKRVRASLAEMHFRTKHFKESVEQLDVLLQLDPTRTEDYYNRAVALENLGATEGARRDFEKFLANTSLPQSNDRVVHAQRSTGR